MANDNKTTENHGKSLAKRKFIAICSNVIGGLYRPNGTVVSCPLSVGSEKPEYALDGEAQYQVDFANLVERTHRRMRHQEMLRQNNLEAVLNIASKLLEKQSIPHDADMESDWINVYFDCIKDVSNKTMQTVWAKAMVAEISRPGTVSTCTLKFLRGCDAWEVTAFRKVAASAFLAENGHPFVFRSVPNFDEEDPLITEDRLLSHCISAGLIRAQAVPLVVGFSFHYKDTMHIVRSGFSPEGLEVGYYTHQFTKIGSDLYRLINDPNSPFQEGLHHRVIWDHLTDYLEMDEIRKIG